MFTKRSTHTSDIILHRLALQTIKIWRREKMANFLNKVYLGKQFLLERIKNDVVCGRELAKCPNPTKSIK